MIDIDTLLNAVCAIPKDNTLYLLEKLPSNTGLFAYNGNMLYIVPNGEHCDSLGIKTDFLHLETNVFVSAFNISVASFENGYYNYIELQLLEQNEASENLKAFVNLCLAHATYLHGKDFLTFFDSLVSLFQLPREQNYKNLVGLIGELFFIEHVYKNLGVDISSYWHTDGSMSKLDIVCPHVNIEIKSTSSEQSTFVIKHDQLFSSKNNYLVTVSIKEANTGITLDELIDTMLQNPNYCNNINFSVNIEKEKRRISPIDLRNKRFIFKQICAYKSDEINPFKNIPDYVENLSYKLNLISFSETLLEDIFKEKKH